MQKHLSTVFTYLFFLLICNFLACKKEEVKEYNKYPIDLKVIQLPNGSYKYSWTGINTSDFKEYWIVRNTGDSVPYFNENNPNFLNSSSIIAKITNANETELLDSISIFGGKTFIRIFAFLENRALSSPNKEIKGLDNIFEAKGNLEKIIIDKKNKNFYIIDNLNRQIFTVDLFDFKEKNATVLGVDPNKEDYLDETGNISQLYLPEFPSSYTVISLPNFNQRFINNFSFSTRSLVVCRDKFLVFANSQAFFSKNKTDLSFQFINQIVFPNIKTAQLPILRWLKSKNQILALNAVDSLTVLNSVGMDQNGIFGGGFKTTNIKSLTQNDINKPFVITPLDLFALVDNQGAIIDLETFKPMSSLASKASLNNVKYLDFTFSTDEKFVYALREGKISTDKKIDIFEYPAFTYVKSISYKSEPKKVFYHDNKLKLAGKSPNNANFTMFEVINP
jgi:hypothetical protein